MPMEIYEDKIVMRAGKYNLPKPWENLTDDEMMKIICEDGNHLSPIKLATAIQSKLKEKNA